MPRSFFFIFATMVILWVPSAASAQERALREQRASANRIALLVGNSEYQQTPPAENFRPLKPLRNACNDVIRIAAVLESEGWAPDKEIIQLCDATRSQLSDAAIRFKDAYLESDMSFGFIYYAGHGVQVKNETYLFGIDTFLDPERIPRVAVTNDGGSIFRGGVRLFADVISQVGDAGSGSIFVVIDACRETLIDDLVRNNPQVASLYFNNSRQYPRPLLGVKLLYSTAYGELASDGIGGGSPFALAFEQHMRSEGRVDILVSHVIKTVKETTRNDRLKQIPDTTGALNPPPPEACLTQCGASQ